MWAVPPPPSGNHGQSIGSPEQEWGVVPGLAANRASLVETFCLPGRWAGAAAHHPSILSPAQPASLAAPAPGVSRQPLVRCLQGIKKPYNPILGETFRCCWFHPQTNSHTFYIAEQARATPGWARALRWALAAGGQCLSPGLFLGGPTWDHPKSPGVAAAGGILSGCRPHHGCDSRVSLGRAQSVPLSWGPLGGTRGWQAAPGPSPKTRLPSRPLLGPGGNGGGPGLPTAGAVARPASPPTGLPPPTRVRLPRQQPEGRLLHQRQYHRQVPVLR